MKTTTHETTTDLVTSADGTTISVER
ncbi:MAG: hypothetical protein QOE21_1799, partial [Microbacteriaceae bacterium]|nr:hypothetical protein [Microbacteriaceae bacterium]